MAEIDCRKCTSPRCDGCNIFILATALKQGKFDSLMNENRTIRVPKAVGALATQKDQLRWRVDTKKEG